MTNLTHRNLVIGSGLLLVLLIVLTERSLLFLHAGLLNPYEKGILEPIFVWAAALFVSGICLFFSKGGKFNLWLRYVLYWYLPLGLVLTFLTSPNLSYAFPDRLGVATLLGWGLVILTVGFVIVHLVLDWKKKQSK
jgi:hypothetical protein